MNKPVELNGSASTRPVCITQLPDLARATV
jgi:hypothetical protein